MQRIIEGLGARAGLEDELAELGLSGATPGRVLAQHTDRWLVATAPAGSDPKGSDPLLVPARGRLREVESGTPVTGDWVAIDEAGAITAVLERRSAVVRRAPGEPAVAQVLAANVDLALVTEALPDPNARRAERLAALTAAGGVPAALVLTKADQSDDGDATAAELRRRLGLADALAVSARDGDGLGVLRTLLAPGSTAVLLGPSGAGKSTLVNALLGTDRQATAPVRAADGRGRHTTVTRELIPLPGGALVIDTPGIREAGLWEGVGDAFTDIEELAAGCRFADCRHDGEPGCAVVAAVEPDRVAAFHKLAREQAWIEDRKAAARERESRGRSYRRVGEAARRAKGR